MFEMASRHPPRDLRIPRCYSDTRGPEPLPSLRPRLQRESAQDVDDGDISPNINVELVDCKTGQTDKRLFLTVSEFEPSSNGGRGRILHQRSVIVLIFIAMHSGLLPDVFCYFL